MTLTLTLTLTLVVNQIHEMEGLYQVRGLTLRVLMGTGQVCHPRGAGLGGQDVQGLRPLLAPPLLLMIHKLGYA